MGVIRLHRLNGETVWLNPDVIERVEAVPEALITTVDGSHYAVVETPEAIREAILTWRAEILARAGTMIAADGDPGGREAT